MPRAYNDSFRPAEKRRRAERQVVESGHLLERILQSTPAVIFIYNLHNYSLEYVNAGSSWRWDIPWR
jgi:hypothetical protein